jgi:hypothetical protein
MFAGVESRLTGDNMSFHDLQADLAGERIEGLRRDADHYRLVHTARRARARRRLGPWRRAIASGLAATIQGVNDILGAIISPAWPTGRAPTQTPLRQSPGR